MRVCGRLARATRLLPDEGMACGGKEGDVTAKCTAPTDCEDVATTAGRQVPGARPPVGQALRARGATETSLPPRTTSSGAAAAWMSPCCSAGIATANRL